MSHRRAIATSVTRYKVVSRARWWMGAFNALSNSTVQLVATRRTTQAAATITLFSPSQQALRLALLLQTRWNTSGRPPITRLNQLSNLTSSSVITKETVLIRCFWTLLHTRPMSYSRLKTCRIATIPLVFILTTLTRVNHRVIMDKAITIRSILCTETRPVSCILSQMQQGSP